MLLVGLGFGYVKFESANVMFARSICTSLDKSELKINIDCNIHTVSGSMHMLPVAYILPVIQST